MITRKFGMLEIRNEPVCEASQQLEESGYACVPGMLSAGEVDELRADIERVFDAYPPDGRAVTRPPDQDAMFRYEMLNRSAPCQKAVGHPRIREVIEPLLGDDCHVIANTAWRNPPTEPGLERGHMWHIDAGPHVPRPPGTRWPAEIPYPVFAIGAHILLQEQRLADGPTGVIPGSHRSGLHPPFDRVQDADLEHEGETCVPLLGNPGDAVFFVSDVWHRRMPAHDGNTGRFFLQVHYGRRDIAQRLRAAEQAGQVSEEAKARAGDERERSIIGLHTPYFYDG